VWKFTTNTNYLSESGVIAPIHVRNGLNLTDVSVRDASDTGNKGIDEKASAEAGTNEA